MKVRLKKRRSRFWGLKLLIVGASLGGSFLLIFKILYNSIDLDLTEEEYLDFLVNDSFGTYNLSDIKFLSSTEFLLKYSFGIDNFNSGIEPVVNAENMTDVNIKKESTKPLVYIFNTHQTEGYQSNFLESFNINNTVYFASHILGEYLSDLGLGTVVEENAVVDILNANGWKYGRSYKASRILLENAYRENPSLKFFIDLHRDSASYERTVLDIDGKKYAKMLFVVGLEHDNYQANLDLANKLNEKLKAFNPSISRGVLTKKGPGVNGIYNQDFHPSTILVEVGGQYNNIEEVNNSLKVLANAIYEVMGEMI